MPSDKINLGSTDRSLPIALLRARETVMEPVRDMLSESGISEQKWRVTLPRNTAVTDKISGPVVPISSLTPS